MNELKKLKLENRLNLLKNRNRENLAVIKKIERQLRNLNK